MGPIFGSANGGSKGAGSGACRIQWGILAAGLVVRDAVIRMPAASLPIPSVAMFRPALTVLLIALAALQSAPQASLRSASSSDPQSPIPASVESGNEATKRAACDPLRLVHRLRASHARACGHTRRALRPAASQSAGVPDARTHRGVQPRPRRFELGSHRVMGRPPTQDPEVLQTDAIEPGL